MNATELILSALAEGGAVKLYGQRTETGWRFRRKSHDWTPLLEGEPAWGGDSGAVDTWEQALELLDDYPWYRMHPGEVHPEFRREVLDAVKQRWAESGGEDSSRRIHAWIRECQTD